MSNRVLDIATQVMVMAIVISVILLFVGIGVLVFIHVCVVGRAFRRGFGGRAMAERGSGGGMSKADIEKLPCFDFMAKDCNNTSTVDCCAICLESFKNGDKCRLLPICRHSFHAQCVDSWLLKEPICPICRTSADSGKAAGLDDDGVEERNHLSDSRIELGERETHMHQ